MVLATYCHMSCPSGAVVCSALQLLVSEHRQKSSKSGKPEKDFHAQVKWKWIGFTDRHLISSLSQLLFASFSSKLILELCWERQLSIRRGIQHPAFCLQKLSLCLCFIGNKIRNVDSLDQFNLSVEQFKGSWASVRNNT